MKRKNFPRRREIRNEQAKARQAKYDKLPAEEKLAIAGKKQRKRLPDTVPRAEWTWEQINRLTSK